MEWILSYTLVQQFLHAMILTPYEVAVLKTEVAEINKALKKTGGDKKEAAKLLQLDRKTIYNKLNKYKEWEYSQFKNKYSTKAEAP